MLIVALNNSSTFLREYLWRTQQDVERPLILYRKLSFVIANTVTE